MARALIIGAGAIGRGFLPWVFQNFDLTFYDSNQPLIESLNKSKGYKTFMSLNEELKELRVSNAEFINSIDQLNLKSFDIAIVCVGPRNLINLSKIFSNLTCPLYSLENDSNTVFFLRNYLKKENIYFGVPDVITSLTASPENLELDVNALHTENGVLYLEDHGDISKKLKTYLPDIKWVSKQRMLKEWDAKLYIHNTPHCIAAYYGYLMKCNYLHEALEIKSIKLALDGVVDEVLQTLKIITNHDHDFLEWYAAKEISRFSNPLLFDPITRVAREPLRKLDPEGRLVGILKLALEAGVMPINLANGIAASLRYNQEKDSDFFLINNLDTMGIEAFLDYILRISSKSIEGKLIINAHRNFRL